MDRFARATTAVIGTYCVGLVGYFFANGQGAAWYGELVKPALAPDYNTLIIIWLVLYALMGIAASLAWLHDKDDVNTEGWIRFYFIQLLFNAGWTIFFFGYHAILLAFADTLVLGFMVICLTVAGWEIGKPVTILMLPYFLWTLFAAYLGIGIWMLN